MLKLTLIFVVSIYSAFGYITNIPDFLFLESFNEGHEEAEHNSKIVADGEALRVLDLEINMFDNTLKLRKPTQDEQLVFNRSVGPLIEKSKSRRGSQKPAPRPSPTENQKPLNVLQNHQRNDNRAAVIEIMTMVNKFILSALGVDRDSNMPESTDIFNTPSLALYFKGPYCAVILKYGKNEWKFFFTQPSPLPSWFYEDHTHCSPNQMDILVPEYVQDEFYSTFSQLLKLFFRVEM